MTKCSYCGTANLDGSDVCEHCLEPLGELEPGRIDSEMERCLLHDRVVQLLPRKPFIVEPSTTVGEVLERLVERSIGCVLVVEDERLVGIFTERDAVVRVGVAIDDVRDHPISEFMTSAPETVEIDAQIAYALQRMDVGGYRHLAVTSQGRVIGVISIRDILKYLARHLEVVEY